jgi:hypothetical protein
MVRTWKCLLLMEWWKILNGSLSFGTGLGIPLMLFHLCWHSYHYYYCPSLMYHAYFTKILIDKLSPEPSQLIRPWPTVTRCSNHCQTIYFVDRSKVFTAQDWRYILFAWKKHVAKVRPSELREKFQERPPDWSNIAPPYWQV